MSEVCGSSTSSRTFLVTAAIKKSKYVDLLSVSPMFMAAFVRTSSRNVVNPCKPMKAVPPITCNVTKTQQETPVGDGLFLSLPHSCPLGENLGHLDFQPAISAQRAMCSSVSNHLHFRRTAGPAQAKMS